jgi:hypothetical protein
MWVFPEFSFWGEWKLTESRYVQSDQWDSLRTLLWHNK